MEYGSMSIQRLQSGRWLNWGIRFFLTAALTASQTAGGYAPFALGCIAAAGPGADGAAALLGGVTGALLFLDFAVPRDIDPEAAQLPHVTLYNIDQFSVPPSQELERQVRRAEELLCQEQARFEAWEACRDLIPRVDALGTYLAGEVDFRIRDVVKELHLSQEQDRILTRAVESATGKVLKKLMFAVRDNAGAEALRQCLSAMEQVTRDG